MANEHPVENLMRSTMENLRDMIDVNTVIGEAVETRDGSYIIPISKVTFGFASGGSEFGNQSKSSPNQDAKHPFGGGSGAGVTVKPVAFLVVREDSVRLLPVDQDNACDRVVDSIPTVLEMFKGFFNDIGKHKKHKDKHQSDSCNICDSSIDQCNCDDTDSSSNNLH
ncbi:GerW family sporulation protein [Clostridium chauvoei]|uniref:GerW family sporulation protein n=2 Tax=Clostridium chauvoei TaxID=46867 RepID=A0ABD4REB4_9CLOT|nr:GerW family sporulation protein [Clostridium chauvoei]ATD55166.1 sporulation protein YtfJ [Clostridium chauvoei]ATD57161.1 sporulation protein YtfJ [Clostridium chauvoei]MBX7279506.1 GerW family sporulation protein [Clostridium chauvoei]MBX7281875.1 GerW family sporulation protein [Clostridium chauvoei]MBX7284536.1 GerW family sporulation protein [Clostridium chauvoei]